MFKKINRLPVGEKILGSNINSSLFSLKISKNSLPYSRFGFIVSKKIDKRAVVRNSLKRNVRACVEELFDKIKPGYDLLFLVSKDAIGKNHSEVCREVNKSLVSGKII